jgi:peptidoglycan/xylan/chitin deacetylase (PgdA/CDA1 family)
MHPDTFRERMQTLLRMGATVLPLDDAVSRLQAGTLPPLATAITFDDGFADFASKALPVLEELNLPATLYLTSWYSQHRQPITSLVLDFVLWRRRKHGKIHFSRPLGGLTGVDPTSQLSRAASHASLLTAVHALNSIDERFSLTEQFCRAIDPEYELLLQKRSLHLLSREELRLLPSRLIDIQLHTHRHRLPNERAVYLEELHENRSFIETLPHERPAHFCYPSGAYEAVHLPWLAEAGIVSATTCEPSLASREDHPLLLPRLIERETLTRHEFSAWVTGIWPKISDRLSPPSSRSVSSRRSALRETR